MTSIRCMLRFAHSPLNITKNNNRVCICGKMETELHLFFHCNVHCAARTALHNKVHDILNETGFAERFERLDHTDLLRLYLHRVPNAPTAVSVAIFNAVEEFLKCCDRFQLSSVFVLCIIYVFFGGEFTRAVFWKLDVTRQNCTSQATACSKIVVK